MNNPILPTLDGLLSLSQTFSESVSQKNWTDIEDLEKEHGASDGHVRQMLSNGTALSTLSGPADLLQRASVGWDASSTRYESLNVEQYGEDPEASLLSLPSVIDAESGEPLDTLTGEFSARAAAARSDVGQAASLPVRAAIADWQVVSEVALSPGASDMGSGEAALTATAVIEHGLTTSGPVVAAQKLHAATRSLSAEQVSVLIDKAAPVIARLVEQAVLAENSVDVTDKKPRDAKLALVLAHVAAAIDKDPRQPPSIRLLQDISAIVLSPANQNDNTVFSGLARTIAVGAGLRLVLAVAADLAHHDENPSRAKTLVALMVSAFADLGARIDAAYADLLQQAGPLCLQWLSWREMGEDKAIARLIALINEKNSLLEDMSLKLERLEQAGLDAFRAVCDLAVFTLDPKLDEVRSHFLNSSSVFASIAGSRTALRDIRQAVTTSTTGDENVTLDMVRLSLTDIGFSAPRAAFLADLCELENNALMLGAGWTALENFQAMERQGQAFQRLLSFLNGQFVMAVAPDVINFGDDDMQA
ncbi:hypothetical protein GAO09_24970 [Rhizobiales bacterium RZME27]|uniref:Uncharacterized protein n=1 Tax=Endobacterium cereale TaxID=2663029 RepID=A0A6A8ADA3_9HYPH|nr:hypothetical protein [Endobacterium cereale]MEB2847445.1 hypothetical protein [Endobacterium cereale]MQY49293.1 hypothetical protein [Endobacterium cereale]